jgi:hypothetical protein
MRRILFVSIVLLPLMGCGSRDKQGGVISGKITYKNQPVNGAMLQLHPDPGPGVEISIPVTQEGTFRASNIPPGEYKIVVSSSQAPPGGRNMPTIPKGTDPAKAEEMRQKLQQMQGQDAPTIAYPNKYKNIASTDLKCTIKEGDQTLPLELKD